MTNLLDRPGPVAASRRLARDRRTAVPLYVQLREALRADIEQRGLEPGDRLPTEAELEARYGVSRSTIRQAVGDLEAEGLLRRIQGKGTFVATRRIQHVPVLTSFSDLLRSQGHRPAHRLLDTDVVVAPSEVRQDLELDETARCRRLERVLLADDDPVGVSRTWLPLATLGAHDDRIATGTAGGRSLYELLGESAPELVPHTGVETIRPALAGGPETRLLACEPGTALLQIHRLTWTVTGAPLEFTQLLFVPGRYEYRVQLQRPDPDGHDRV